MSAIRPQFVVAVTAEYRVLTPADPVQVEEAVKAAEDYRRQQSSRDSGGSLVAGGPVRLRIEGDEIVVSVPVARQVHDQKPHIVVHALRGLAARRGAHLPLIRQSDDPPPGLTAETGEPEPEVTS